MRRGKSWGKVNKMSDYIDGFLEEFDEGHDDWSEDVLLFIVGGHYVVIGFVPIFLEVVLNTDPSTNIFWNEWRKVSKRDEEEERSGLIHFAKTYKTFVKLVDRFSKDELFDIIVEVCDMFLFESDEHKLIVKDMRVFFNEWRKRPENEPIVKEAYETIKKTTQHKVHVTI